MTSIPAESEYGAKEKTCVKLDAGAQEALVNRLYGREADRIQKKNKAFDEAVEYQVRHNAVDFKPRSSKLSAQEEVIVKNVYDNQVALRKKKREMNEERALKESNIASTKKISEEDKESIVSRLYNQSVEARKKNIESLTKKQYGDTGRGNSPAKRDKEAMNAGIAHLYTEAIRKKKEADEKLEAKYGWKKVKCAQLDPEEIKQSAARLSTKQ